jgi:hypothetical protein
VCRWISHSFACGVSAFFSRSFRDVWSVQRSAIAAAAKQTCSPSDLWCVVLCCAVYYVLVSVMRDGRRLADVKLPFQVTLPHAASTPAPIDILSFGQRLPLLSHPLRVPNRILSCGWKRPAQLTAPAPTPTSSSSSSAPASHSTSTSTTASSSAANTTALSQPIASAAAPSAPPEEVYALSSFLTPSPSAGSSLDTKHTQSPHSPTDTTGLPTSSAAFAVARPSPPPHAFLHFQQPSVFHISKTVPVNVTVGGGGSAGAGGVSGVSYPLVRLALCKRLYHPADAVKLTLDFLMLGAAPSTNPSTPRSAAASAAAAPIISASSTPLTCYQVTVTLEREETMAPKFRPSFTGSETAPPSADDTAHPALTHRTVVWEWHQYTLHTAATHLQFSIPRDAVVSFATDMVSVCWRLRVALVVDSHPRSASPNAVPPNPETLHWSLPLPVACPPQGHVRRSKAHTPAPLKAGPPFPSVASFLLSDSAKSSGASLSRSLHFE